MLTEYKIDGEWDVLFLGDDMVSIQEIDSGLDVHITLSALEQILRNHRPAPASPQPPPRTERRHYSPAFRRDAVAMVRHMPLKAVARQLGVGPAVIRRWRDADPFAHRGQQIADVSISVHTIQ